MPVNLNDGSSSLPRLKVYLNLGTLTDLPVHSIWPKLEGAEAMAFLKEAGFEGAQDGNPEHCQKAGIGSAASGRVDKPADAEELARRFKGLGHEAATVHVGYGFEDDAEMDRLARAVLEASDRVGFPLYVETHRATITQDAWRTIQLTKRIPEIRFNGDFSHFYTGQELPYGDLEAKWQAMQPIFDRVRFMHGRIGNTACMQVDIGDGQSPVPQGFGIHDFLAHYREMWTRAMAGFLNSATAGDYLVLAPEILAPYIYYARKFAMPDGSLREESDRYAQALVYARIAGMFCTSERTRMITERPFGKLPTGEEITEYTLTNARGMIFKAIDYGGIITQLHVPDREGKFADIVLGFDNLDQYLAGHPYFGCIAGRVAGRITRGEFTLDGKVYRLAINDPPNHLHGGNVGFDKRFWIRAFHDAPDGTSILFLGHQSPASEEGYPGTVTSRVRYILSPENELKIEYSAMTDAPTPISLTSHSYFNLAGEGSGSVEDHLMQINADEYSVTDEAMTHLGRKAAVRGAGNDFTSPRRVGDVLPGILKQHGDNYFLRRNQPDELVPAVRLSEPTRGRVMEILTTAPCVQFYSGRFLDGSLIGKSRRAYNAYGGLCLECQSYPNGVNNPELGDIVIRPGETYRQVTVHKFSVSKD